MSNAVSNAVPNAAPREAALAVSAAGDAAEESPHVAALLPWIRAHGRDAVAFQGLEPGLQPWFDAGAAGATDTAAADAAPRRAAVAYCDTGSAWVAAGGPLAAVEERAAVASRFCAAAAAAKRRACFFCVDDEPEWPGFSRVLLGEQPAWQPEQWQEEVRRHRKLREQLRRARAKGVRVRRVAVEDLADGAPLRRTVEAMASAWLGSRSMEPMGFLVTLAPFVAAAEHRYYLAEQAGRAIAFLSLVPVPARRGWLLEDLLRVGRVPNGTSELLVDCAMSELAADGADYATTGLAPLSGEVPRWMRAVGDLARPLYDFRGLRRFKQRLHPPRWERVWMCYPRGGSPLRHLLDALRAFAPGGLLRFAASTALRRPGALAWMLGVPLAPWALLLAALAVSGHAALLGFATSALASWAIFDGILAFGLWRASRAPSSQLLGWLALAAAVDALLSTIHLGQVGLGSGLPLVLRLLATVAPLVGAPALWWARQRARAMEWAARGPPP